MNLRSGRTMLAATGVAAAGSDRREDGTDPDRNRGAPDISARHGLKMWIADARFDETAASRPETMTIGGIAGLVWLVDVDGTPLYDSEP